MTREQVERALGPLRAALEADGYGLEVLDAREPLRLRVVAGPGACEDCLVPAEVMSRMVSTALAGAYAPEAVHVEYPA